MKVLFVTANYPSSYNPVSGIMVRGLVRAMRQLNDADFRVVHLDERLIAPFTILKRYHIDRTPTSELEPDPDWLIRYRVSAWPGAAGISWRAKRWVDGLMGRIWKAWPDFSPDIIHARTFIPSGLVCERLAEKWNCPLMISTHGVDTRGFLKKHFAGSEIIRLCKKKIPVVCVSELIREVFVNHGVDEENLHLIYNGMDISKVYKGAAPLNGKYNDKYLVLGLGNLQPYKGFDIFIEAIAQLHKSCPDICGVIIGGGREELKLRNQIRRLELVDVVELTGAKPAKEAMEYMAACKIFCLPSWSEGFGIAYLEAMAHGKPVIAVKGQGIDRIIRENSTGILVEPKNVQSVVEALRRFRADESLRRQFGERGKKLVFEKFTWAACARKYMQLYSEILKNV